MRIRLICTKCAAVNEAEAPKLFWPEVQDDGAHLVTCDKGHVTIYLLQEQKFEILFELGLHAIVDGYYREAVSSIATSLERFYEFAVRVFTLNNKVDATRHAEAWSIVAKQSERQLGAYIFAYLSSEGTKPKLLPDKCVAFRNEVVHKGKIPTKPEAIAFSEAVVATIYEPLRMLRTNYSESCELAVFEATHAVKQKYEKAGTHVTGVTYPMTL